MISSYMRTIDQKRAYYKIHPIQLQQLFVIYIYFNIL